MFHYEEICVSPWFDWTVSMLQPCFCVFLIHVLSLVFSSLWATPVFCPLPPVSRYWLYWLLKPALLWKLKHSLEFLWMIVLTLTTMKSFKPWNYKVSLTLQKHRALNAVICFEYNEPSQFRIWEWNISVLGVKYFLTWSYGS